MERVFDYKDIHDEKKINLVALKPHKYTTIQRANTMAKRAKTAKAKNKLKAKFLSSHHLHDNDAWSNAV